MASTQMTPTADLLDALTGWTVRGEVLGHAEREGGAVAFVRLTDGPYERKADAERMRDHYLYGPYTCKGVRIEQTGMEGSTMATTITTPTLTPALLRSLRTFGDYPRTVPEGSPVYKELHTRGLVQIVGTRYGRGAGRHSQPLWVVEITEAGRAALV